MQIQLEQNVRSTQWRIHLRAENTLALRAKYPLSTKYLLQQIVVICLWVPKQFGSTREKFLQPVRFVAVNHSNIYNIWKCNHVFSSCWQTPIAWEVFPPTSSKGLGYPILWPLYEPCLIFIIFYECVWIFLTWILSEEWDLAFGRDLRPTPLIPFPVLRLMTSQWKRRLCSWCGCPLSRRPCRQWHTWPRHGVKKMLVTLIKSGCLCRTTNGVLGNPVAIQSFGWPKWIEGREEKQHKLSCKVTFVHLMLFLTKFLTLNKSPLFARTLEKKKKKTASWKWRMQFIPANSKSRGGWKDLTHTACADRPWACRIYLWPGTTYRTVLCLCGQTRERHRVVFPCNDARR